MNTALNRTSLAFLTNKSGGDLVQGDVVVLNNTDANGFTTTTSAGLSTRGIGVIFDVAGIANNATGAVAIGGWCPVVNLNTASTVGQFIRTHTVAGQGTPHSSPQLEGDFGVALDASSTPSALLFGNANPPGTGANVNAGGTLTTNAVVIGQGSTAVAVLASLGTSGHPLVSAGAGSPPAFGQIVLSTAVLNGIGVTQTAVAAATDSDSDTTMHDDPELLLSVVANAVYVMEAALFFTTGTSTAPDVKIGYTFPAAAVMTYAVIGFDTAGTALTQLALSSTVLASTSPTSNARGVLSTATSASSPVLLNGILRTGANAGTLQFQFAQNTADATAVQREANSYISIRRVS